ncbi:MAG TPA: DUF5655 domain-containing protein [Candidatus Dormibacteraeota bacterium]|jgi:hypothetical protein|nr:DUF5655 domain-containing protein [Candidatus Dormibacteraeota bacterium]
MAKPAPTDAVRSRPRTWLEMRERIEQILERRTGEGVDVWAARVAALGDIDETHLRSWLTERGITGYPQMILVMERFGYPDYLLASADELIDGQYTDRPQLRPVLDELLLRAADLGEVDVQARKTYVTLVTPKRTFALIRATTRDRVDLGLRLPGVDVGGRLLAAPRLGNDYVNVRIALQTPDDVDDLVVDWLRKAYAANV